MIPFEVIALSPYARELLTELSSRQRVTRLHDAKERIIEIRAWQPGDSSALHALYDAFFTAGDRARTFPPLNAWQRSYWIEELTSRGPNVVARASSRVVGHAALVPHDGQGSHELVLFVHPEYRQAGIGGALLDAVLEKARRDGVARIWVGADAPYALRAFYEGRGFAYKEGRVDSRATWSLDVKAGSTRPWHVTERLVAATAETLRVRLVAMLRGLRIAMIPLVCALIIATVSEDPRGRALGIILSVVSVLFGVCVQLPTIISGKPQREGDAGAVVASTGEWRARLR